jgi:hypothetical protein
LEGELKVRAGPGLGAGLEQEMRRESEAEVLDLEPKEVVLMVGTVVQVQVRWVAVWVCLVLP